MSLYLQLGHESWKLLEEPLAGKFRGLILSPVNDTPMYVSERLKRLRKLMEPEEVILDPQLYNPASQRGKLPEWPFYTADFESADRSSRDWWRQRSRQIVSCAVSLGATAVCSPAFMPRVYTDDYYKFVANVADDMLPVASEAGLPMLLTAIVSLKELTDPAKALSIASVLSSSSAERVYLLFVADQPAARQPIMSSSELASAVHLVRLLAGSMRVHVAFSAHDLVLWKGAGSSDISTGKWMNVRRFSPGRWSDEEKEGRLVPYWNEHNLLTLLRDQEVLRLDREHWFDRYSFESNVVSTEIMKILKNQEGGKWQRLSSLQYLNWCNSVEPTLRDADSAERMLLACDSAWEEVMRLKILFADRFNNGDHVRDWINALREGMARR